MSDSRIFTSPPNSGSVILGRTLPSLLDEACERFPNSEAFNQLGSDSWRAISNREMRASAEALALGLLELGLERGDRVALLMESDTDFVRFDMACLIAGLVDVPLYLTSGAETVGYILRHSEARVLVCTTTSLLASVVHEIPKCRALDHVIVVQPGEFPPMPPDHMTVVHGLRDIESVGHERLAAVPAVIEGLKARIDPHDAATIIYTSGTTGEPKGVVLSHENISSNGATAFTGLQVGRGSEERAASFLPMSHIFGRTMMYGCMHLGFSIYFFTPDRIRDAFPQIRPTIFASVPRVLEKVYDRIIMKRLELSPARRRLFDWSLGVGRRFKLAEKPAGLYRLQLALADRILFSRWREALGGKVRTVIAGGAAFSGELVTLFTAAGIDVLQGYGLTETSPVVTYNRPTRNRAWSVGEPLPGVEVTLASDGEVLTRGPHVMIGYFRDQEATAAAIDDEGWFHTGDIGVFSADGFLSITDRKKAQFKLSTGKYVFPQPAENRLMADPLVEQAMILGPNYKFCSALIFVNEESLRAFASALDAGSGGTLESLCKSERVLQLYSWLVEQANEGLSPWERIKRFDLITQPLTIEDGFLTPTLKVRRTQVMEAFRDRIEGIYLHGEGMSIDTSTEPIRPTGA